MQHAPGNGWNISAPALNYSWAAKTFEKDPSSRGTNFTVGNLKGSQGGAQVAQTSMWDGTPETETWTQAGGKGTYTFKGKMKRVGGSVGAASITVEGSVSGLAL